MKKGKVINREIAFILIGWMICWTLNAFTQPPPGYYDAAAGLSGTALQQALHQIIKNHQPVSYNSIWTHFATTDKKPNGKVWDIYSDIPGGNPPYEYTFFIDQCGNYNSEGDCYNREHSFPVSWFGGENLPMYTDLHHIFPTDGYVNMKRANYPYGKVGSVTWTSMNGSKLGYNSTAGYSGLVFEPIDAYKGDLARMHFYMATRYYGQDQNWPGSPSVTGSQLNPWALNLYYQWHMSDPVSQKEIDRNNAIFQIQQNRNPFVDHPEFAGQIWFTTGIENTDYSATLVKVWPNPVSNILYINIMENMIDQVLALYDMTGRKILETSFLLPDLFTLDLTGVSPGYYFLQVTSSSHGYNFTTGIIKLP